MPRGRPKKLSNYEQMKAKKIRSVLSSNNISRFDDTNDAHLLDTVYVDTAGKVFVSYEFHDGCVQGICTMVNDFARR
jgi:hypothetical protein